MIGGRHPAGRQVADVAVDGPLRDLQLFGQVPGAHQLAPPQDLDDVEQAVGPAHGVPRPGRELTPALLTVSVSKA
jgi:hypothetical protein